MSRILASRIFHHPENTSNPSEFFYFAGEGGIDLMPVIRVVNTCAPGRWVINKPKERSCR
jgi:hypothetical protein